MKHYTSRFLRLVALYLLTYPVSYLMVSALLFDIPLARALTILLSPGYYLLGGLAIVTGFGLWEMKRFAWYTFLITLVWTVYWNTVFVLNHAETHHKVPAFSASVLMLLWLLVRVGREVRVPYFLPTIRWWESNPRFRLVVPARITLGASGASEATQASAATMSEAEILDISMGGCFLKLKGELLAPDAQLKLEFALFQEPITIEGVVVWKAESSVTHPRGVGVKFAPLNREQKRVLKAATQRLKEIAAFYRSSRYLLSYDEFSRKLERLQSAALLRGRRGASPQDEATPAPSPSSRASG